MGGTRVSVTIEPAGGRYEVSLHRGDEAIPAATGSFDEEDLPKWPPIAVDGPRAGTIPLAETGAALFELLLAAGLDKVWPLTGPAPQLLLDVRDAELAQRPWELVADPRTGRPFASRTAPAARARLPFAVLPEPAAVPIRLLVVVGSPDDDALEPDNEIEAIYQGLAGAPCAWNIEVVRGPEQEVLFADYADIAPDVLHVIGHGVQTPQGPAVQMRGPGGDWELTAQYLVETLADSMPRLVVLNACRTAERPNDALPIARGLVDGLLGVGVAATVSIQGDVASPPAATFARELYRGLAARKALDAAVAEARAVVGKTTRYEARDWALPVLDLRADPAQVLHHELAADPLDVIRNNPGFDMVARMVDRAPQRRDFHDGTPRGNGAGRAPSGLVYVTGGEKVGKTILARWCVVSHRVGGTPVVYYSLEGRATVSTRDFLIDIVEAAQRWFGVEAETACADTTRELHAHFAGALASTDPPAPKVEKIVMGARPGSAVGPAAAGYSMVTGLLSSLALPRPVVLVLDHLGMIEDKKALVSGLLRPASANSLGNLRVVVVEQEGALNGIAGPRGELPISPNIPVEEFKREQASLLVREYLARCRPAVVDPPAWDAARAELISWASVEVANNSFPQLAPRELLSTVEGRMLKFRLPSGDRQ